MTPQSLPRPAQVYVGAVILAGTGAIAHAAYGLAVDPPQPEWLILAALTLLSGFANVKLASIAATISVSETFVLAAVVLFGPSPGTITVALDAFVLSVWVAFKRRSEFYRLLFNIAAPALSIWVAAHSFFVLAGVPPLAEALDVGIAETALPLLACALIYFLLNSWLVAFAIALQERVSAVATWRNNFVWPALNFFGGASVAALLVGYRSSLDVRLLLVLAPILIVLYVTYRTAMGRAEDANRHLERVNKLYLSTIETLAMAIDAKDQVTHGHIRRVQSYAVGLAKAVGVISTEQLKAIEAAALLHDMGKLAVPEYILNKPGKLTDAEFNQMKTHAAVGADILSSIEFPYPVVPIVRHHHENWDGTGYPDGLKGTEIPVGARILSVVDCFDALTSDRPYRPRLSTEDALTILADRRATMYDPLIIDVFMAEHDRLARTIPAPPEVKGGSSLAAIAEASARLEVDEERRPPSTGSDVVSIYELGRALTGQNLTPEAVAELVGHHLRHWVRARVYAFYMTDHERNDLYVVHALGDHEALLSSLRIPLGQRLSGWVAVNRGTILNSDPFLDLGEAVRTAQPALTSALSVALPITGPVSAGALSLYSDRRFTQDDARVIELVARHVGEAFETAAKMQQSRSLMVDSVTGLPGIEYVRNLLSYEIEAALRGEQSVSLLVVDVNRLKLFNEGFGRSAGDALLSTLTQTIKSRLRITDILLRSVSDEFLVALPQTDFETALGIRDRIAAAVREDGELVGAGISLGAASAPVDGNSFDALVETARARQAEPSGQGASATWGDPSLPT